MNERSLHTLGFLGIRAFVTHSNYIADGASIDPPFSAMEDARPAPQRALNTRDGPRDRGGRHPRLPPGLSI